ncbi:MAG TPA: OmpA family protein [Woeseiaceae bacterium]|nr:OmpA family protein [Woeseiaceae bacterium]
MRRASITAIGFLLVASCLVLRWPAEVTAQESTATDRTGYSPCERMFGWLDKDTVHFGQASSWIRRSSYPFLQRLGEFVEDCPGFALGITGYTDAVGDAAVNQELSEQRARAVADFLVRLGVDRQRLVVTGLGAAHPVADNDTIAGRKKNRRIEFQLLPLPAATDTNY